MLPTASNDILLEKETDDFASQMFPPGLVVVHDPTGSGHNYFPKLPGRKQVVGPLFVISDSNVESGGYNSHLVNPASQIDDDFAAPVIIYYLEFADVSMLHHDGKEADDDAGARSEAHLALAPLFGVVDALQSAGQTVHQHHLGTLVETSS